MTKTLAIFVVMTSVSAAVKYPNDIEGSPIIECNRDVITIHVNTTNRMASKIFAKNHNDDTKCTFKAVNSASFNLGVCGMSRKRQLEPKGLSYNLVVIVQLHPIFITKVDRAYNVKCFYTEALNTVTAGLEVSMLQTDTVTSQGGGEGAGGAISGAVSPPQCTYSLHIDSPAGSAVKYAKVGDKVWHLWECASDTYGMLIHSCYVADGQGNEFQILDRNGCGIDEYVLRTPEYSVTLNKAQQETHVFKFADKMVVLFNCQVKLCIKANDGCRGVAPPDCSNATARGITGERLELSTESIENSGSALNVSAETPESTRENENATTEAGGETVERENSTLTRSEKPEAGESTVEGVTVSGTNETKEAANETLSTETNGVKSTEAEGEASNSTASTEHGGKKSKNETETESESSLSTATGHLESGRSNETVGTATTATAVAAEGGDEAEKNLKLSILEANLTSKTVEPISFLFHLFFSRNETATKNTSSIQDARERRNTVTDKEDNRRVKLQRLLMDSVADRATDNLETDVSQRIWVLEPEETSPFEDRSKDIGENEALDRFVYNDLNEYHHPNEVCLPTSKFSFVVAAGVFFLILSSVFCICLCLIVKRRKQNGIVSTFNRPIEPPTVFSLYDKN